MRKIVIINQTSGYLMADIANSFGGSNAYDEIVLVSGKAIKNRVGSKIKFEKIASYNRRTLKTRLFSWVAGFFQIAFKVLFKYRKSELFIVSNPPLVSFLTYLRKKNYSVLIYDIYPDALVSGGFVSEKSIIYKWWVKANIRFYKNAFAVYTISKGMSDSLSKYSDKVTIVPIWYDSDLHYVEKSQNSFIVENGIQNKYVILYSGNIGKGHNVRLLVEAAKYLKEERDIVFVIIGDGWEKKAIEEYVKENSLDNVLLLPYQPYNRLSLSLSSADLAYVSIEDKAATLCVPSKTFNFLKLGIPLLCVANTHSELAEMVDKYKIGAVFGREDVGEICSYILYLKNNPKAIKALKSNILRAKEEFSPKNANRFVNRFN